MKDDSRARNEHIFQLLEDLLAHMHPKEDTHALVEKLKMHFQSADALFSADGRVLERLGVHKNDALLLSHMVDLARYLKRTDFDRRADLSRYVSAAPYMVANFYGLQVERFYLFCLDTYGRLKARVLLQEGTSDGALFSLKRMLSEVVQCAPQAVIISHNHPGQTRRPSQEDIDCTLDAIRALTVIGIPLLDHVIVAGTLAVSIRGHGFIPASQWLAQQPQNRLLRHWLDGAEFFQDPQDSTSNDFT